MKAASLETQGVQEQIQTSQSVRTVGWSWRIFFGLDEYTHVGRAVCVCWVQTSDSADFTVRAMHIGKQKEVDFAWKDTTQAQAVQRRSYGSGR